MKEAIAYHAAYRLAQQAGAGRGGVSRVDGEEETMLEAATASKAALTLEQHHLSVEGKMCSHDDDPCTVFPCGVYALDEARGARQDSQRASPPEEMLLEASGNGFSVAKVNEVVGEQASRTPPYPRSRRDPVL